jgi:hypothetical protein
MGSSHSRKSYFFRYSVIDKYQSDYIFQLEISQLNQDLIISEINKLNLPSKDRIIDALKFYLKHEMALATQIDYILFQKCKVGILQIHNVNAVHSHHKKDNLYLVHIDID